MIPLVDAHPIPSILRATDAGSTVSGDMTPDTKKSVIR